MLIAIRNWSYKWLPIIFGCHCRADRSFIYKKRKFPICARCTGELIGIIFAIATYKMFHPSLTYTLIIMIPMLIDGFVQLLTKYESNNTKRVITGMLFGYALVVLYFMSLEMVYNFASNYAMEQKTK